MAKEFVIGIRVDEETLSAIKALAIPGESLSVTIRRVIREAVEAKKQKAALQNGGGIGYVTALGQQMIEELQRLSKGKK
jgi:protein-L-isoaspartate O-methyltransferase